MASGVQVVTSSMSASGTSTQQESRIPWYIWCGVLAITSPAIGVPWDLAWHNSIGRDSFFVAPHVAIYLGGVLAAISCGFLIFSTTFGRSARLHDCSVSVLGFRAPLGTFLAAWGGITMMTAGAFDNWYHSAYGLDVKLASPPHVLLIGGLQTIVVGVFVLILGEMNRAARDRTAAFPPLQRLLLYGGGLMIANIMIQITEFTFPYLLHIALPYKTMALAIPLLLAFISQTTRHRWAATWATAIYSGMIVVQILIFPLFSATPKLGPVYTVVTHLIPTYFPILLIVPAVGLDVFWQRTAKWKLWKVVLVSGFLFTGLLVAAEWPFASFLMSKWSENRFFGTIYFPYSVLPDSYERLRIFLTYGSHTLRHLTSGFMQASLIACVSAWIGLVTGRWMRGIQR